MPFDILCVDSEKQIIVFIEVKYGKSQLTENQRKFKEIIDSMNNCKVVYVIWRVNK